MKSFYSHITKIKDEKGKEEIGAKIKFLIHHIIPGVLTIALNNFLETSYTKEVKQILELSIKLHDLGKYTIYFQNYLKTNIKPADDLHTHSYVGACTAFNILKSQNETLALYSYFIILHHHSNLNDIVKCYRENTDSYYNKLKRQTREQQKDLLQKLVFVKRELGLDIQDFLHP